MGNMTVEVIPLPRLVLFPKKQGLRVFMQGSGRWRLNRLWLCAVRKTALIIRQANWLFAQCELAPHGCSKTMEDDSFAISFPLI